MSIKHVQVKYHNMFGQESDKGENGIRVHTITIPSRGNIEEDRETVFRLMNHVDGSEHQLIKLRERSMSVGDSVIFDVREWGASEPVLREFRCDATGWTEV